jgi:hypothetical protein
MGGLAFLGLVLSLIGWINLYGAHRDGRSARFTDATFEWFFAGAGSLIFILSVLLAIVFWLTPGSGPANVLSASGVTYADGVAVPWSAFEHLELVWRSGGGPQLIGRLAPALPTEVRRAVTPHLANDLRDDLHDEGVPLHLGDVDDAEAQRLRHAVKGWAGREVTERLLGH